MFRLHRARPRPAEASTLSGVLLLHFLRMRGRFLSNPDAEPGPVNSPSNAFLAGVPSDEGFAAIPFSLVTDAPTYRSPRRFRNLQRRQFQVHSASSTPRRFQQSHFLRKRGRCFQLRPRFRVPSRPLSRPKSSQTQQTQRKTLQAPTIHSPRLSLRRHLSSRARSHTRSTSARRHRRNPTANPARSIPPMSEQLSRRSSRPLPGLAQTSPLSSAILASLPTRLTSKQFAATFPFCAKPLTDIRSSGSTTAQPRKSLSRSSIASPISTSMRTRMCIARRMSLQRALRMLTSPRAKRRGASSMPALRAKSSLFAGPPKRST